MPPCYDLHPHDLGISSANYMLLAQRQWAAPLVSLRFGGWAPLPLVNCTFFTPSVNVAPMCNDYAWTDSTPLDHCCSCGGGTTLQPPPPPPAAPAAPCHDLLASPDWLIHTPSNSWSGEGEVDCAWM